MHEPSLLIHNFLFILLGTLLGSLFTIIIKWANNNRTVENYKRGIVKSDKICPYWQKTLCHANVYRDHKMCKGCPSYPGDFLF